MMGEGGLWYSGGFNTRQPWRVLRQLEESKRVHRHFPVARPIYGKWYRDSDGNWAWDLRDHRKWEVVCKECGDTDGPAELQPPAAQVLRGPFRSKRLALRVENEHFEGN